MSNIDEAAEVIARHNADGECSEPECLAQALADAGLLMPDLPEPDFNFTDGAASWAIVGKAVVDSWSEEGGPVVRLKSGRRRYFTPTEARSLAYNLLAAANHVEKDPPTPKTFADMTPEQRAECVGMWATNHNYTGEGESVGVIACVQHDRVWLIHTHINGEGSVFSLDTVSPRFDLPRAWTTDGTPIKGHWNYGEHLGYTVAKAENAETADLRCFVGEWEKYTYDAYPASQAIDATQNILNHTPEARQ